MPDKLKKPEVDGFVNKEHYQVTIVILWVAAMLVIGWLVGRV